MRRPFTALPVIAALLFSAPPLSSHAATPAQTLSTLVGTWNCVTTDSKHRIWRTVSTDVMFGRWLYMVSSYPAQNGQPAGTAAKYLGFDPPRHRWIVASIDASGDYYVMDSSSAAFSGSHWQDQYPHDNVTGYVQVQDADQYTFDSPGSHTVCRRMAPMAVRARP